MESIESVQIGENGRPKLQIGESEVISQPQAYFCDPKSKAADDIYSTVQLTTHRLICCEGPRCTSLSLSKISNVTSHSSGGLLSRNSTPKLVLTLSQPPRGGSGSEILIRFKGKDLISEKIKEAVRLRVWERTPSPSYTPPSTTSAISGNRSPPTVVQDFSASMAGVSGLMRREESKIKQADETLSEAFRDADALFEKAKDLVAIADRIKSVTSKGQGNTQQQDNEFDALLLQMGISAPVTRSNTSTSAFHSELSRQLADFCLKAMKTLKQQMISLTDLYCLFNRARGTELVSPDDIYHSCQLFEQLNLSVRLHKFPSGVIVIRSAADGDDESIAKQILKLILDNGGHLSAVEIAQHKKIPLALAKEQALLSERIGVLCRDDSFEGLVFFPNIFPQEVAKLSK